MKRLFRKILNTMLMSTLICFVMFLYLFANNVTPPDIDYFVKDTGKHSEKLAAVIKQKAESVTSKTKENVLDKISKSKKTTKKTSDSAESKKTEKSEKNETQEDIVLQSDTTQIVYYSQTDERWSNEIYGADNTIGTYGCGPTTLAMVLSSFTDKKVTPLDAAKWAYDNGHFSFNSGSYHSIIPKGAEKHGLNCTSLVNPTKKDIINDISKGHIIVVLMNKGSFTSDGHFIILRGITKDSKVLIADSKSLENSQTAWDIDTIINEAKYTANHGGPFWSISKP